MRALSEAVLIADRASNTEAVVSLCGGGHSVHSARLQVHLAVVACMAQRKQSGRPRRQSIVVSLASHAVTGQSCRTAQQAVDLTRHGANRQAPETLLAQAPQHSSKAGTALTSRHSGGWPRVGPYPGLRQAWLRLDSKPCYHVDAGAISPMQAHRPAGQARGGQGLALGCAPGACPVLEPS